MLVFLRVLLTLTLAGVDIVGIIQKPASGAGFRECEGKSRLFPSKTQTSDFGGNITELVEYLRSHFGNPEKMEIAENICGPP